jgi:hypothetical protein
VPVALAFCEPVLVAPLAIVPVFVVMLGRASTNVKAGLPLLIRPRVAELVTV